MKLSDLLTDIEYVLVQGNLDIDIKSKIIDTKIDAQYKEEIENKITLLFFYYNKRKRLIRYD